MTWPRCASSNSRTASQRSEFSQFMGPQPTTARFAAAMAGGLKTWHASIVCAEREATVLLARRSCSAMANIPHAQGQHSSA